MDKILILDGYDEIHHRVNQTAFWADMKWFEEHGYKVILTTRPGYLKVPETWGDYAEISLRLFDEEQTKEWLSRYQEAGGRILPETFRALTEPQPDEKYDEIRRIPIMLYVIANRNINVQTVTCMGELYERVFEGMKRDKAGLTAETLDRHYLIAQKIAYEMERKGVLAVSSETARQWCGDLFDETFFLLCTLKTVLSREDGFWNLSTDPSWNFCGQMDLRAAERGRKLEDFRAGGRKRGSGDFGTGGRKRGPGDPGAQLSVG